MTSQNKLSILDLLLNRATGPIHIYATKGEVERVLGIPDDIDICRTSIFLIYGPLEIGFRRRTSILDLSVIYFNPDNDEERAIRLSHSANLFVDYKLFKMMQIDDVLCYIEKRGEKYIEDKSIYVGDNYIAYRPLIETKAVTIDITVEVKTKMISSIGVAWKWKRPRKTKKSFDSSTLSPPRK